MRCRRLLPLVAALLCTGVPVSFADQVVYFVNGKAIMVKSVEKGDKFTVLEMDGGGRIGVPTDQISRIEDYVVSEPVAVAPQVAAVPAAPPPGAAPAGALPQPAAIPGAAMQPPNGGAPGGDAQAQRLLSRPGAANGGAGGRMGAGAGRPNFMAGGRRPGAGRTSLMNARAAGRFAELSRNTAPPGATSAPPPSPGAAAVPVAPVPGGPGPTAGSQPEEPPPPPDEPNEEPSDPSTPEGDDASGTTPGGPS